MARWVVNAIIWVVATVVLMLFSWEAKRYYTNNRSRIFKSLKAAKNEWIANPPEVSSK